MNTAGDLRAACALASFSLILLHSFAAQMMKSGQSRGEEEETASAVRLSEVAAFLALLEEGTLVSHMAMRQ